jgi:hypothetical protein
MISTELKSEDRRTEKQLGLKRLLGREPTLFSGNSKNKAVQSKVDTLPPDGRLF